jgi:hypothetical protein
VRGTLLVFASYLAISVAFTWPLARFDPGVLVTRHFDLYPSIWLMERARVVFPRLHDAATAWPFGENLARVDSYLLLLLGWLDAGTLGAQRLASLVALLGPAIGALAAERCASRAFGVRRPWSWIAGCAYGFSGINATALLEGHIHHVLNPWLPLLLETAWTANEGEDRWKPGIAAGIFWTLALYTTAYAGVMGAVLLLVVILRGGLERLLPGMLLVAIPSGAFYLWLFSSGDRWTDGYPTEPWMVWRMGSLTLGGLAGWSDAFDERTHSLSAPVGFTTFWLMLFAPLILRKERGWRTLVGISLIALFLAMGRSIRLGLLGGAWWSPTAILMGVPQLEWFRFPARLARIYALCGGVVAARVADTLARGLGTRWVAPTLAMCVADAIVGTGLPWRLRSQIATVPSAYDAAPEGRAVLDLYAPSLDRSGVEVEMWSRVLSCYYQAHHQRPILEVCIGTQINSPREVVSDWLSLRLLSADEDMDADRSLLAALGVGAVALHADLYRPSDRRAMIAALTRMLGEPAADTTDGGEHVVLFTVPAPAATDPPSAWEMIRAQMD